MGVDIVTCIERKKNGKYELLSLYKKTADGFVPVQFYTDRNYELFDKLAGRYDDSFPYLRGLPKDISDSTQNEYCFEEDASASVTWYDYVELKLLAKTKDAIVRNSDTGKKYNVLNNFVDRIDFVLEANGVYFPDPGDVRVIVGFSY